MGKFYGLKTWVLLSLFLAAGSGLLFSQSYQFRNYSVNEGLPGPFVYTINQDNNGFIWLGTGKGIVRYDSYMFHEVATSDLPTTAFPVSSLTATDGTIYYGFSDGKIFRQEGSNVVELEGVDAFRVNSIVEDSEQRIIFVSQSKGLFRVAPGNAGRPEKISSPSDNLLYCAAFTELGDLLLGTQQGITLSRFRGDALEMVYESPELEFTKIQAIVYQEQCNRFILGSEDDGVYSAVVSKDSVIISRISDDDAINRARVQSLLFDNNGNLWISTFGDGAFKIVFSDEDKRIIRHIETFNSTSGLLTNDIKTLFQDSEGNLWLGLFGEGLSILGSDAYSFYKPGNGLNDNNIVYLDEVDGNLMAGTNSGYYIFDPVEGQVISYTDLTREIGTVKINLFHRYINGSLLIGTDGSGVYQLDKNGRVSTFYSSSNNLQNYISDIEQDGDLVWIATMGGVVLKNSVSGEVTIYTTYERLPHNKINQIIPDGKGKVYIATEGNRLYTIDPVSSGVQAGKALIYGGVRNNFQSIAIDSEGKIWGATEGAGIYCFAGDSVWGINSGNGLLSDFCYSILCDSHDNIWIGHQQGFSLYDQDMRQVRSFEDIFQIGADCNRNAAVETAGGLVAIGTSEGIMIYDRTLDQNRYLPPVTNILSVSIGGVEYPYRESYNLPYSRRWDIEINYAGLYYSDPGKVWYRTRLDNYDDDWSDPVYSRVATYKLSDGNYRFHLVSYNYDGITDNNVEGFNINIRKPIWRMWWFILSMFLIVIGLIIVIIRIRERSQRKVKEYLETELAERTKVVIIQKEEIELQNREITDSINYAQRIQASLLPPVSRLEEAFNGAFVFFRPRDIVSGDFYWFEKIDDERFIIICADSTGHGVPGAFMSMIGSALIQDIVTRKEITRPSEVLVTLDREISKTLNQNVDDKSTSDGMDMVVCEFNKKTKMLRFASAMRPMIMVMGGEQYYIRGNKSSVGGENLYEKFFDDQEYYLKENDSFYMFSDGLPDQFGGEFGKKMKIARLKRLIDEIKDHPMETQFSMVSEFFDNWKGELEQVDDVLVMGIKV